MSEEFSVNIALRQGSALSPLMLIMVMELVSRKVNVRGILGRMVYADEGGICLPVSLTPIAFACHRLYPLP